MPFVYFPSSPGKGDTMIIPEPEGSTRTVRVRLSVGGVATGALAGEHDKLEYIAIANKDAAPIIKTNRHLLLFSGGISTFLDIGVLLTPI